MALERKLGLALSHFKTYYYRFTLKPSQDFDKNITYIIVWDRREILKTFNDKVKSLSYVKSIVPNIKHPKRYFEVDSFENIDLKSLPEQFVCKVSHGSGGVVLVHKKAAKENTLPSSARKFGWGRFEVSPTNFDYAKARKIFGRLMKMTYGQGLDRRKPEWGYWFPEPKLIVEEYLSLKGEPPKRITCNVVDGTVEIIIATHLYYSKLFQEEIKSVSRYTPSTGIALFAKELQVSEESIEEIIKTSILIAADCGYLRVDWLLTDQGFLFSELTPYSGGGNLKRENDPDYLYLSNMWRPKRQNHASTKGRI